MQFQSMDFLTYRQNCRSLHRLTRLGPMRCLRGLLVTVIAADLVRGDHGPHSSISRRWAFRIGLLARRSRLAGGKTLGARWHSSDTLYITDKWARLGFAASDGAARPSG